MNNITLLLIILILIIILLIFTIIRKNKTSEKYIITNPLDKRKSIDIVYTWVDNTKDVNKKLMNRYVNNDELLYSLRSVEKYMPWVNHIYLVVHDGQRPEWLVKKHPKLTIVPHSKIIPKEYLPTFNSMCIESFIHKIPNLSEFYIYFNDDCILLNSISSDLFFDDKGLTIESEDHIISTDYNYDDINRDYEYFISLYFNDYVLNKYLKRESHYVSQHIPSSNRISYQSSLDLFLDDIKLNEDTKKSKYRKNTNIARNSVFKKYWNVYIYNSPIKKFNVYCININNNDIQKDIIEHILTTTDQFLCIQNNINYEDDNIDIGNKNYEMVKDILSVKFPKKSSFEKK